MQLREGDGNSSPDGAVEGDRFNTVWVLDSGRLPFHRAEAYHQFHNGIGKPFGPEYKVQIWMDINKESVSRPYQD